MFIVILHRLCFKKVLPDDSNFQKLLKVTFLHSEWNSASLPVVKKEKVDILHHILYMCLGRVLPNTSIFIKKCTPFLEIAANWRNFSETGCVVKCLPTFNLFCKFYITRSR